MAKHGSVIFIISDFTDFQDDARIHFQPLARHNEVIGIHISDPLEQDLPAPDLYSITDGSNRSRINTANKSHRIAYRTGYQQEMARVQEEFMRVRSPLLTLQTNQSIVDGLNRQSTAMAGN